MNQSSRKTLGLVGAAAATGAALAGAYYYYGSENAERHRRQLREWANKAERDIVSEAKKLKKHALTNQNISAIITEVARRYEKTKDLNPEDVREFISRMQGNWHSVKKAFVTDTAKRGKQKKPTSRKRKSTK